MKYPKLTQFELGILPIHIANLRNSLFWLAHIPQTWPNMIFVKLFNHRNRWTSCPDFCDFCWEINGLPVLMWTGKKGRVLTHSQMSWTIVEYTCTYIYIYYTYIWVSYNNSLTWNKVIWGYFPLLTMIIARSQWGRYNLHMSLFIWDIVGSNQQNRLDHYGKQSNDLMSRCFSTFQSWNE